MAGSLLYTAFETLDDKVMTVSMGSNPEVRVSREETFVREAFQWSERGRKVQSVVVKHNFGTQNWTHTLAGAARLCLPGQPPAHSCFFPDAEERLPLGYRSVFICLKIANHSSHPSPHSSVLQLSSTCIKSSRSAILRGDLGVCPHFYT